MNEGTCRWRWLKSETSEAFLAGISVRSPQKKPFFSLSKTIFTGSKYFKKAFNTIVKKASLEETRFARPGVVHLHDCSLGNSKQNHQIWYHYDLYIFTRSQTSQTCSFTKWCSMMHLKVASATTHSRVHCSMKSVHECNVYPSLHQCCQTLLFEYLQVISLTF